MIAVPPTHASGISDATLVEVLLVSSDADHPALRRIFTHTRWRLFTCERIADAVALVESRPIGVVICREQVRDGTWNDLLSGIDVRLNAPKVIVASAQPTTKLWSTALTAGADYVLRVPFDTSDVLRTIGEAWHRWWFARVREARFDRQLSRNAVA